jgi:hypothetical protein
MRLTLSRLVKFGVALLISFGLVLFLVEKPRSRNHPGEARVARPLSCTQSSKDLTPGAISIVAAAYDPALVSFDFYHLNDS